jgi:hypothetical protein
MGVRDTAVCASVVMKHGSNEHRMFAMETLFKNDDSATIMQCVFRCHFNINRNIRVPLCQTGFSSSEQWHLYRIRSHLVVTEQYALQRVLKQQQTHCCRGPWRSAPLFQNTEHIRQVCHIFASRFKFSPVYKSSGARIIASWFKWPFWRVITSTWWEGLVLPMIPRAMSAGA